ncbi:MAG: hypothetical protein IAE91_15590 [Ignavibacteriaceae bacterium]|nr:hypothetical protein [Ignavibacteriaceae bacterium]
MAQLTNFSFRKKKVQVFFNNLLSKSVKSDQIKNHKLTDASVSDLVESLIADSGDYYFNGLISLLEGIENAYRKRYSWATVKLYYSYYYFIRSELYALSVGVARDGRKLYSLEAKAQTSPELLKGGSDHISVLDLHYKKHNSDLINTQTINLSTPFNWLRDKREIVNYKINRFQEPAIPDFWEEFDNIRTANSFESTLQTYISKNSMYWYIENIAVIALPLKRLVLTKELLTNKKIVTKPTRAELKFIKKNFSKKIFQFLNSVYKSDQP